MLVCLDAQENKVLALALLSSGANRARSEVYNGEAFELFLKALSEHLKYWTSTLMMDQASNIGDLLCSLLELELKASLLACHDNVGELNCFGSN